MPLDAAYLSWFQHLSWHRMRLSLVPRRTVGKGTPAIIVLNALLKSVKTGEYGANERPRIKRAFCVPGRYAHRLVLPAGKPFQVDVLFFGADDGDLVVWLERLGAHLAAYPAAGFDLAGVPGVTRETADLQRMQSTADHAEFECLSPLPFKRANGAIRTHLTLEVFLKGLQQRIRGLFGDAPALPPEADLARMSMNTLWWHYTELRHASKSQPGNTQFYNGCFGSLYFHGEIRPLIPWLVVAAQIHAGGSLALNPFGYGCLHLPARPYLDNLLAREAVWKDGLPDLLEGHDELEAQLASRYGAPLDAAAVAADLAARVLGNDFLPLPALAFTVPKRTGVRRLEKLQPVEHVAHATLYRLLREPIDRTLEDSAQGYRRGRSVETTVASVRALLDAGYRYAIASDIEDFFPSVDLARLEAELNRILPPADVLTRALLRKLLSAPSTENGHLMVRQSGLAQGSPLSPLLANLYLDRFDEVMEHESARMVRYADDFVILTRTREIAEMLLARANLALAGIGLQLGAEKTAIVSVEEGFRFLGQPFGGMAGDAVAALLAQPARKTVYITEAHSFLGHNGDALEIRRQGQLVDTVPFRRISDIVVLEPATFSSGLVQKCAAHGVPLTFTLGSGYHVASLAPDSRRYHGAAEKQALHYAALSPTERLALAKGFAAGKIENYRPLIASRYRAGHASLLAALDACIAGIEGAADTAGVRGYEGRAARLVQRALNDFIQIPEFKFTKRLRDKPDRMNVLFNFGYYLLFSRLNTLVRAAGLNPYLGFLHDGADDYETLVCDIEELFRVAVDRLLVSLVNLRIIKPDDFRETERGLRLQPVAIKRFLLRFEEMLHGDAGGISILRAMEMQVEAFKRYVASEQPLWYFRYKAALRADGAGPNPPDGTAGTACADPSGAGGEDVAQEQVSP